jgi:glycosyltransferase 2 family protein
MKKLISAFVSLAILLVIYWRIDVSRVLDVFAGSSPGWLLMSLGMVIPITGLTARRLQRLVPAEVKLRFRDALTLTLAASVLNLLLPSKMGDVAKSYFIAERGHLSGSSAVALVVYEKGWDMLALLAWCVLGLLIIPKDDPLLWVMTPIIAAGFTFGLLVLVSGRFAERVFSVARSLAPERIGSRVAGIHQSWTAVQTFVLGSRRRAAYIVQISLIIWFLHLLQIWMFILALNAWAPLPASLGLAPLAILAGLLPLTFAGIGTRDAALIFFFQGYFAAPVGAALGVLCTLRYVVPALAGLPFLSGYLTFRRAPPPSVL